MTVQNVVLSARLLNKIDIAELEEKYNGLCYQQPGFPVLCLKDEVSTLCQIFKNGKVVVIGGKSEEQSNIILRDYLGRVNRVGFDVTFTDLKVQNIVARLNYGKRVKLQGLHGKKGASYEPEIFPSAVKFRMEELKITANIFYSGKIMLLGAKSVNSVYEAAARVTHFLNNEV